jgi:hypothetical protein
MVVAGILIETAPGAEARVAARLLALPGITLEGGDGQRRIAAVLQAASGAALEDLTRRVLAEDEEVLGIYPTFVGAEDEAG